MKYPNAAQCLVSDPSNGCVRWMGLLFCRLVEYFLSKIKTQENIYVPTYICSNACNLYCMFKIKTEMFPDFGNMLPKQYKLKYVLQDNFTHFARRY